MKEIIQLFFFFLLVIPSVHAQTYYNMWRGPGEAGKPEWIANTAMAYPFTGIQFTTADRFRGAVTGNGRWLFWDPTDAVTSQQNVVFINNNLNKIPTAAAGTEGSFVASRYVMTDIGTSGNIDAYFGYGRNRDVMLSCQMQKWLRINSYSGIAFWGNGQGEVNDTPSFLIANNYMEARLPLVVKDGAYTLIKNGITTTINGNVGNTASWMGTTSNHGLEIGSNGKSALFVDNSQNVLVGFDQKEGDAMSAELKDKYNLIVKKGVLSNDFAIAPNNAWADFVFDDEYPLRTLSEIEDYISRNGHLPDVPSAEKVANEGYTQHEMNKVLLQKIEELTLYIFKQQKEINRLKSEIQDKINIK